MNQLRSARAHHLLLASGALITVAVVVLACCANSPTVRKEDGGAAAKAKPQATMGRDLYLAHCAGCHGENGDGNGLAARFLNPKPRNFGEGLFRLVTTSSNLPSDEDLARSIRLGMPGSAMFSFDHLGKEEMQALVVEVKRLIREGMAERIIKAAKDADEDPPSPEDLAKILGNMMKPGAPLAMPATFPKPTEESIARGAKIYAEIKNGCVSCHGTTGKGDGVQDQKNSNGTPTRPRDFTRGIFKSGRDARELYARVLRGMPGSPMPSTNFLKEPDLIDLLNYILSLSTPESSEKVKQRRRQLVARRVDELPANIPDSAWQAAASVPIVVTPLWWREYPEPDFSVSALHDGKEVAFRLSWTDATGNQQIHRPDDFEDMAAVQLFQGQPEPFLGMGAANKAIDLWLWRASWTGKGIGSDSILDDYPFDMPLYKQLTKGKEKGLPNFATARAVGNPNARTNPKATASQLAAKGLGSTTFLPPTSQLVTARGAWKDGKWTVILRRPLSVKADQGVSLAPGTRASVAFGLWFGEARDRNGQKLVSIWHDLTIE